MENGEWRMMISLHALIYTLTVNRRVCACLVIIILNFRSIATNSAFIRQLRQIVGFELDAVQLVVAAEFLDFLLTFFTGKRILAILVGSKFTE